MPNSTHHTYPTHDGTILHYAHWPLSKNTPIRGVVQLSHGIGEHCGRYNHVAKRLNKAGFVVYANDHRGHGRSAKNRESLGQYEGNDFWEDALEDMYELTKLIKKEYPDEFFVLFGHSMGSMLSRDYLGKYGKEVDAAIISGTASYIKVIGPLGNAVTSMLVRIWGNHGKSEKVEAFFFDQFNRHFKPNRTKLDWISRDENEVDKFYNDPLRSELFDLGILRGAAVGAKRANASSTFKNTPPDLPIYIFSGDQDPVGEMGEGVKRVARDYEKLGCKNVTLKIYHGGRHEMLNETNKEEVIEEMIAWLERVRGA